MCEEGVKPAINLKLKSLEDLARLLASKAFSSGKEVTPVFYFKVGEFHVYGSLLFTDGFFDLNTLPIFVYYVSKKPLKGRFIGYRIEAGKELVEVVDAPEGTGLFFPVIELEDPPLFIKIEKDELKQTAQQ